MPKGLGGAVAKAVRFAPEFNDRENPMSSGTDGRPYGRAGGHLPDVGTQEARQSAREVGGGRGTTCYSRGRTAIPALPLAQYVG